MFDLTWHTPERRSHSWAMLDGAIPVGLCEGSVWHNAQNTMTYKAEILLPLPFSESNGLGLFDTEADAKSAVEGAIMDWFTRALPEFGGIN